jgi:hypothetical protein
VFGYLDVVVAMMILAAWVSAGVVKAKGLTTSVETVAQSVESTRAGVAEIAALALEYADLRGQNARAAARSNEVPPRAGLSLISTLVPEGVVLEEVEVKLAGQGSEGGRKPLSAVDRSLGRIRLKGSSLNDATTVALLKNLTGCELLQDVRAEERGGGSEDSRSRFIVTMDLVGRRVTSGAGGVP